MNHIWIFFVVGLVALVITGSILGRKQQEWKNLLRIAAGVALFVVCWCSIISSNLDQWSKVGILALACLVLWLLNMVKALAPRRR